MEYDNFSVIEKEFHDRVTRIVWCTMTTIDRKDRPRSRIMHPIWEGHQGWLATGRDSLKARHIAHNPWVSLCYWDPDHKQVYAECKATWADDQETKKRVWDLYKSTPEPVGYDLSLFWPDGAGDPGFGVMSLVPWRVELSSLADMANPQIWRQTVE